jgi:hypothetical protein
MAAALTKIAVKATSEEPPLPPDAWSDLSPVPYV